jgi:tetraacyldisaccharide 4'-kinase
VYISPDRPAAARALLEGRHGVDVIVSDDGLQHYALARDLEIAVVDGERRFGNALPLPAGPLREPVARLAKVDAIVVNGGDTAELPGAAPKFGMRLGRETFVSLATGEERDPRAMALGLRGQRVAALAGIGHPPRFFEHLARLGIPAEGHAFPDHHLFQPRELRMRDTDAILMTEKDAVKCRAFADARMWFLRVDAILPAAFDELVLARLAASRSNDPRSTDAQHH